MKIIWVVSTQEDVKFLRNFRNNFNGEIDIFHLNYITRVLSIGLAKTNLLPRKLANQKNQSQPDEISNSFNVLSGRLCEEDARHAYNSTYNVFEQYIANQKNKKIITFIPSGRLIHHKAIKAICNSYSIKTIYINYSNFPGYTFFDSDGTDAEASIYHCPKKVESFPEESATKTFKHFAKLKEDQKSIPQARKSKLVNLAKRVAFLVDTIAQNVTGVYGDRRVKVSTQITKSPTSNTLKLTYSEPLHNEEFAFFPLQVSTDQQILINYDKGSIYSAIDEAIDIALKKQLKLYIKEHPAEGNPQPIAEYLQSKVEEYDFIYITNTHASTLIKKSTLVITINSTVGLEARISNKEVVFLGKSFYAKATDIQLAKYLKHYLVKCDYHSPNLNKTIVEKILSYAN